MNGKLGAILAGVCTLGMLLGPASASAQDESKEKPPLYTYVSNWTLPRPQWAEMAKADAADRPLLDKAMADGTIVGYGNDIEPRA